MTQTRPLKKIRKGPPDAPRLRFWFVLAWQTIRHRSIVALSQEMKDPFYPQGLENLPAQGSFVLAVNHTNVRWTPRLLASIHVATLERRPDLAKEWLVVAGSRALRLHRLRYPWQRWFAIGFRRVLSQVYRRWAYNCVRIPLGNEKASLRALREWRTRATKQPSLVFPEGRGAATFQQVRPGAGRWLARLGVPVLPVAAWWDDSRGGWALDFGLPLEWATQPALHDLQLGLAMAETLPTAEAPDWQEALLRWQVAHSKLPAEN